MSTLPDPQSPVISPEVSRSGSTTLQHPDLSNEVATLSNKLIRAINHQTDLDDTLAETRHELNEARRRLEKLEAAAAEHDALVSSGGLLPRSEVERQKLDLMNDLANEQKQRGFMEKDKRGMEQELESLTTALFEEANQMVAAARKEREVADRRGDQLRAQLNDTELLLATHQEQLAQLKTVMHQMSVDREESDLNFTASTSPSTPALQALEVMHRADDPVISPSTATDIETIAPAPPTSFTHLLHPVLRTDLQAYDDFQALLSLPRTTSPSSRVPSGSFGNLNVTNLSNLAAKEHQRTPNRFPSNGSTSSLSSSALNSSSPIAPSSTSSSVSSRDVPVCAATLKETRFYKRVVTEDIEPTLRLDIAPGLSWLARRTVVNSFLRMLKNGHWRADDDEAELLAWEECVRLRERMFWARIGGGVVPTLLRTRDSPRISMEQAIDPSTARIQNIDLFGNDQPVPKTIDQKSVLKENSSSRRQATTRIDEDDVRFAYDVAAGSPCLQPTAQSMQVGLGSPAAEQRQKELYNSPSRMPGGLGIEDAPVATKGHSAKESITMPGAFE
ncbi:MAG: hypothetical protein Q9208_000707 [Pyrenodesmia sp. 3 TL-2023]